MARALAGALAAALLLAACALPGDERTFSAGSVTVVDGSGLVTGVREGAPDPASDERPLLVSPGSLTELAVHWTAPSCVAAWRVTIPPGNALRVIIAPADPPPDPCDAAVEARSVTLELNRVVQADAIEVEQRDQP